MKMCLNCLVRVYWGLVAPEGPAESGVSPDVLLPPPPGCQSPSGGEAVPLGITLQQMSEPDTLKLLEIAVQRCLAKNQLGAVTCHKR